MSRYEYGCRGCGGYYSDDPEDPQPLRIEWGGITEDCDQAVHFAKEHRDNGCGPTYVEEKVDRKLLRAAVLARITDRRGRLRRGISKALRFQIFVRDNFACRYCGASGEGITLHIDHFVAVARGGTDEEDNLVTACADCNLGKSDMLLKGKPLDSTNN